MNIVLIAENNKLIVMERHRLFVEILIFSTTRMKQIERKYNKILSKNGLNRQQKEYDF